MIPIISKLTRFNNIIRFTFNAYTEWWRTPRAGSSATCDSRFITIADISKPTKNINISVKSVKLLIIRIWLHDYCILSRFIHDFCLTYCADAGTADAPSVPQFSCRQMTVASLLPTSLSQAVPNSAELSGLISSLPWHLLGPSTSLSSVGIKEMLIIAW